MDTKSTKYKIRLGLFVALGFLLFVLAIFWIGRQQNLFNATFELKTQFGDVSGLQVGNNVRFSGINVGTVDVIEVLSDTSVRVVMKVDKEVQRFIKRDSYASIGSEGLIGDKVVIIGQGTANSPHVKDGFQLKSQDPVDLEAVFYKLNAVGDNAFIITDQMAEIMYKLNNGQGAIGRLLSDSSIAVNMERTMRNLETGTKGFSENMEAAQNSILLRSYFKKKEKEQEEATKDEQRKQEQAQKKNEKETKKQNGPLKNLFNKMKNTPDSTQIKNDTTSTQTP